MRTKYSFLNILTAVGFSIIVGILSMFRLKYFIGYFGDEVNGFFSLSNSVSLAMTFVEAGMGGIFIQKLYGLLANDNKQGVIDLYFTVKRIALFVTLFIFTLAFVYSFIHIKQYEYLFGIPLVVIIYWLYMTPTIFSYYLRVPAYILMADQREYIVSFVGQMGNVISYLLQIIILMVFKDLHIIVISIIMFIFTLVPLLINYVIALKRYPYLRKTNVSKKYFDKDVLVKMKDCLMASISNALMQSVDSLMLAYVAVTNVSYRLSLISVISIYNGVILLVKNIVQGMVAQVIASFGNLAQSEQENFKFMYKVYIQISFAVCTAVFAAVFAVINKFNLIFYNMGSKVLPAIFVFVIIFNAFMDIIKIPLLMEPVNIRGNYKFQRNVMAIEVISNLVLSYILLQVMGEIGLFVATAIVQIVSVVFLIPRKSYADINEKYSTYLKTFAIYLSLFILISWVNLSMVNAISILNIIDFFIAAILIFLIDLSLVFFISFSLSDDFYVVVDSLVTRVYRNG